MSRLIPLLDLHREYAQIAAEIEAGWSAVLRGMRLLGGREVVRFEEEIAAFIGVPAAVGVASGTDALLLALTGLGIGRGDRVIVPANAFVAALEAIHHLGAVPVLVDVADDAFAPDPVRIAAALPARAAIVVHLYGHAVDLAPLRRLDPLHPLLLVEDGSHAHGAARDGRRVGSLGDAGCFSAGVVKNLAAYGDAGFVTTLDPALAGRIRVLRDHGQEGKNVHVRYGWNSRLDELQAVVLRVKLQYLEPRNARRRAIAAFYDQRFRGLDLRLPPRDPGEHAVHHQYVVRTDTRERLQAHLRSLDIETGIHYPLPLHLQPAWRAAYPGRLSLPNAERLAREVLSLPVFPDLTDAEVERVAQAVTTFFAGAAPRRAALHR